MSSSTLLRPLGFGEILDGAFVVYRRHFAVLFASALIGSIPLTIGSSFLAMATEGPTPEPGAVLVAVLGLPIIFGGSMILSGVLTGQIARAVTGGAPTVADGYGGAIRRLFPLIAAYLQLVLIVGAVVLVVFIAGVVLVAIVGFAVALTGVLEGSSPVIPVLMTALGVVVLAVAVASMFVALSVYFAVVPAVIVEDRGPAAALSRSWQLARGALLRIAGVTIIAWIILALPSMGFAVLGVAGLSYLSPFAEIGSLTTGRFVANQVLSMVTGALTWPFYVGCITLLYFDRRVRTEAFDLEAAADALPARG